MLVCTLLASEVGFLTYLCCTFLCFDFKLDPLRPVSDHSSLLETSEFKKHLTHWVFSVSCCVDNMGWFELVARGEGMEGNIRVILIQLSWSVNKVSGLDRAEGEHTVWIHMYQHLSCFVMGRTSQGAKLEIMYLLFLAISPGCSRFSVSVGKGIHRYKPKAITGQSSFQDIRKSPWIWLYQLNSKSTIIQNLGFSVTLLFFTSVLLVILPFSGACVFRSQSRITADTLQPHHCGQQQLQKEF